MRIHVLQHVAFEGPGSMAEDFSRSSYPIMTTHWYRGDAAPALDTFDVLIIMGGPMGVYDEMEYPWLGTEKTLIRAAIECNKIVIGICLGAQLIACASGAKVTRNPHREIGWFPLIPREENDPIVKAFNDIEVFHWHGDTFELPDRAVLLASSKACQHQAFRLGNSVFGFQFHLETTFESAAALIKHCVEDLDNSQYVQDAGVILQDEQKFARINCAMSEVLRLILKI